MTTKPLDPLFVPINTRATDTRIFPNQYTREQIPPNLYA